MAEDFRKVADPRGISEFDRGYEVPDCVVPDGAHCSMGRMVALRAARAAGWEMRDANSLLALAGECGVTMADVDAFEERAARPGADLAALAATDEFGRIRVAFRLAAGRALAQGPCLIHDRVDRGFVEGLGRTCACAMTFASDRAAMRVRARVSPLYAHLADDAQVDAAIEREDARRRAWHALNCAAIVSRPAQLMVCVTSCLVARVRLRRAPGQAPGWGGQARFRVGGQYGPRRHRLSTGRVRLYGRAGRGGD